MARALVAVALFLSAVAAYGQGGPQEWARFTPQGGGFSILMPGEPKSQHEVRPSAAGQRIDLNSYTVDFENRAYMVMAADYANSAISLDKALDGILSTLPRHTIVERRPAAFAGYAGRILEVKTPEYHAKYRLVVVGKRLYQIGYIAQHDVFSRDTSDYFINSFKLLR
jgi:hypothetical protein